MRKNGSDVLARMAFLYKTSAKTISYVLTTSNSRLYARYQVEYLELVSRSAAKQLNVTNTVSDGPWDA